MASPSVRRVSSRKPSAATAAVMDLPEDTAGTVIDSQTDRFESFRSEVEFFDVLQKLTSAEWERFILYVYRLEPKIRNANGPAYIEKLTQAIDQQYLKDTHGGGTYQLWLKFPEDLDSYVRKHTVTIQGTPKFAPGQTIVGESQPAAATAIVPAAAAVASLDENAIASIVRTVVSAMQQNQSPDAAGAAMKNAMEIMSMGSKAALEQVVTHNKNQNGSMTGNPIADKLLEKALASLGESTKPPTLREQLGDLKSLREIMNPGDGEEKSGGVIDKLTELKDTLIGAMGKAGKADIAGGLFANAPAILKTVSDGLSTWREVELAKANVAALNAQARLIHLQHGGTMQDLITAAQVGTQAPAAQQPVPVTPSATGTAPLGTVTSAPMPPNITQAVPTQEEAMGAILEYIVDQFDAGTSGDGTVRLIRKHFVGVIEELAPMLSSKEQVIMFAQSNPILTEIAADPDFDEFAQQFVEEIMTAPKPA